MGEIPVGDVGFDLLAQLVLVGQGRDGIQPVHQGDGLRFDASELRVAGQHFVPGFGFLAPGHKFFLNGVIGVGVHGLMANESSQGLRWGVGMSDVDVNQVMTVVADDAEGVMIAVCFAEFPHVFEGDPGAAFHEVLHGSPHRGLIQDGEGLN